jgi:YARHG domain-containing protein
MRHAKLPIVLVLMSVCAAAIGVMAAWSSARADACFDLWYQRNAIYDAYGYCFKTKKGKQYFDNSNCTTNVVKLSKADQKQVNAIIAQEKAFGC